MLEPYPVGLPARLGALDRRSRRRPAAGALGGKHPVEEVWALYARELEAAARSGHFDVLAHPDLVKIFGDRVEWDWQPVIDALDGVALEVSTAGLHKPVGELYPDAVVAARGEAGSRSPPTRTSPRTSGATSTRRSSTRAPRASRRSPCSRGDRRARSRSGERLPGRDRRRRARARRGRAARARRRRDPVPARARRPLGRRRDHARVDRRDPRRGRASTTSARCSRRATRAGRAPRRSTCSRRRTEACEALGLRARERRLHPDRRGAAPRAVPERDAQAARRTRSASTRSGSRCARRRRTGLGFTGRGEGLAAQAVALLSR